MDLTFHRRARARLITTLLLAALTASACESVPTATITPPAAAPASSPAPPGDDSVLDEASDDDDPGDHGDHGDHGEHDDPDATPAPDDDTDAPDETDAPDGTEPADDEADDGPTPVTTTPPPAPTVPAPGGVDLTGATAWSDPATWGGAVPRPGSDVVVPAGRVVVLDTDIDVAGLRIDGTLVCADRDLTVRARWIMVHGGRLTCGTAEVPFTKRLVITLTGNASNEDVMGMGTKVLGSMGGIVQLHGRTEPVAWTSLAADAPRGATSITLLEAPGWQPGDRIVIATSQVDQNGYDVATVSQVTGTTVRLAAPLRYAHRGAAVRAGDVEVSARAEVGLLSRNIVIRGDAASVAQRFGAHLMFMPGGPTTVQLQGVQITDAGQFDRLGRYPIHFHQLGAGCGACYVKDSAIHDTIQRGIVLHDTSGIVVADNVVFNTVGHNVVVETPITAGNVLDHNLALVNRLPSPGFRAAGLRDQRDGLPANYWMRSGRNTLTRNVAAGSAVAGYFYDQVSDGPLDFRDNVVHGVTGYDVTEEFFSGSGLLALMCRDAMPGAPDFSGLVAYDNANSAYWPEDCHLGDDTKQWIHGLVSVGNPQGVGIKTSGVVHVTGSTFFLGRRRGFTYANLMVHHQYGGNTSFRGITVVGDPNLMFGQNDVDRPFRSVFSVAEVRIVDGGSGPRVPMAMTDYLDDTVLPRGFYVEGDQPELTFAGCVPGQVAYDDDVFSFHRCPMRPAYGVVDVRVGSSTGGEEPVIDAWALADGARVLVRDDGLTTGTNPAFGPAWWVILGGSHAYSLPDLPASPYAVVRLDRDEAAFETPDRALEPQVRITLPVERAPLSIRRLPLQPYDPSDELSPGDPVPGVGATLTPVATQAELDSAPRSTYLYDPVAGTVTVFADASWLVIER